MSHLNKDNVRRCLIYNDDVVKFFAWRSFIFETSHLEQRDTRLAMKVVPFVRGLGLTFGTSGSPGTVCIVLLAKLLSETCFATIRLDATKSLPILSAVFRRGTALCGKFSKPGEKMRKRETESFADSLKLLLSTPSASPAEATAPSCNYYSCRRRCYEVRRRLVVV